MFANWAIGRGSFEGKNDRPVLGRWPGRDAADAFKQILTDAGVNLASEIETGGPGTVGNEQDALAAQKFAGRWRRPGGLPRRLVGHGQLPAGRRRPGLHAGLPRPRMVVAHERRRRRGVQPGPVGRRRGAVGDAARRAARSQRRTPRRASPTTRRSAARRSTANPPEKTGEFSNILIACELATSCSRASAAPPPTAAS